jgi:hypothetical protein
LIAAAYNEEGFTTLTLDKKMAKLKNAILL